MPAQLYVVTGTGTGVGKTHVSVAMLHAWRSEGLRAVGWKPIETGVTDGVGEDEARLRAASSFHVKHPRAVFTPPVSPHLAARQAGTRLPLTEFANAVADLRTHLDRLLVELPGGLCTPLSDDTLNLDFIATFEPDAVVLVAPNRIGVLHDVLATLKAAAPSQLPWARIVLSAHPTPDASTTSNAAELRRFVSIPVLDIPRSDDPRALAGYFAPSP